MSKYATKLPNPWGVAIHVATPEETIELVKKFRLVAFPVEPNGIPGVGKTATVKTKRKTKRSKRK